MGISPETCPEPALGRPVVPAHAVSSGQLPHTGTGRAGRSPADSLWDGERPRVLLIEDDAGDALLVEELVLDSGVPLDPVWARSLADALVRLRADTPHCLLLDLRLPDAQGLEALEEVLRRAAGAVVVVLTGLAEEESGLAAVAAGAQGYLVKGRLEADLFARAVRYAIQRKRTEQAAAALQAGRLRAEENTRLERGPLPRPLLLDGRVKVPSRYRPGRALVRPGRGQGAAGGRDAGRPIARARAHQPSDTFVDDLIHTAQTLAAPGGGLADDVAVLLREWTV